MGAIDQKRSPAKTFAVTFVLVTSYAFAIWALGSPSNPMAYLAISICMAITCGGLLAFIQIRFEEGTFIRGFSLAFVLCLPFFVMMGMSGQRLAPAMFAAIALGGAAIIGLVSGLAEVLLGAPSTKRID